MAGRKEARARQCMHELTRIANKLRILDKRTTDFGTGEPLHAFEIHTIEAIGAGSGRTVTELAEWFSTTKGAVSQVVGRLEARGYIAKERDRDNRKIVLLSLTRRGETARAGHGRFHQKMDAAFFAELEDVPMETLRRTFEFLSRASHYLDAYVERES
ncbi:MAG: MarR family transcriptional regulator [bacterium]|nr:MarR family transcriptional regulator [bacterium]